LHFSGASSPGAGAVGTATAAGTVGCTTTTAFGVFFWLYVTNFNFTLFFISFWFLFHMTS